MAAVVFPPLKYRANFFQWVVYARCNPPGSRQGSVLGSILFNIHINDIFFALKRIDIYNLPNDTTLYVCSLNLKTVLETLEHNSELAIAWFEINYMKLNTDKCHLLISENKNEQIWAKLGRNIVWESNDVKLLGTTFDNNLKFDKHVSNIFSKANRKLNTLKLKTKTNVSSQVSSI